MARDVLCEVRNCVFWEQGNLCSAEEIYVVSNQVEEVYHSEETDCKTFEPKQ
ncbi:DUF1540 domain-containing protein [Thermoactinomyces mirandus]|uniref:DUF1540 domain-containing protein n=1 Tax=Thermoactinomyces mirandus TaxID=2756294 RepID=A0A7W1XQK2_9BACL|nr:DUF1540 domain-containing protein [Thermoactinomyces mirandus]MBA4601467.1 DUF1540 domain-containing protein [Thermoactinomyces mirandus]